MESNKNDNEGTSMEGKTVIYGYNDDPKHPEETEIILLSTNQSKSTIKRYKGVWKKNEKWIARIRNPITNSREFLGKFYSLESALAAYFDKKRQLDSQIRVSNVSSSVMIDTDGRLLGDFSRLDDDLRICD